MFKTITLLTCCLFFITISTAQNFPLGATSPGESSSELTDDWEPVIQDQELIDWRETSVGLFFMPIPLNIDSIDFTFASGSGNGDVDDNIFSMGVGVSLNFDFNASGSGFGNITYFAVIFGANESNMQAYDIFTAAKYDIKLGDLSKFELSPLLGIGNLSFIETVDNLALGNSFYFSGGARITWLAANDLFVGADVQSVPLIFSSEKLLGVDGEPFPGTNEVATDVKISYSFPVQINLSLRYNIF